MRRITKEQIEQREDFLAEQEYQMSFVDLPGDIKRNIHNAVLEEFGMRRSFKFTCMDCGNLFEEEVEGELVDIYTDIQSESHTEILQGLCLKCKVKREQQERVEAFEKEFPELCKK